MDNNIEINVIVNGKDELQNLSVSLRRMLLAINDSANATKILDARQRGLNQALGATGRGLGDHAKNLRQVASNQAALSAEIKQTTQDLKNLQRVAASGRGGAGIGQLVTSLDTTSKNLKKVKARAFASDLRSVGQEMKRLGKDAQFVGRSLIIGLTTPIIAFGRIGLQNFYAIDKQLVRLEKLLNRNRDEFASLTKAVNDFSYKFGIAKELLLAVTGDFAELGINSDKVLTSLTDLTAQFTILGDMDVSAAQDLTQTLYLGSLRAMEMSGEAARLGDTLKIQEQATKNVNAQMYIFNALENATALSMREIADTLPEVSAAGLVFGLNFTEMMALLAPMKAVGIDVSAAATGLKVSFQKLVNPTIKLQKELKQLQKDALAAGDTALAFDYENVIGAGMDSIQSLVDITDELMKSAEGGEGALKFYSQLFDDRQATRMLIAFQDLANFQSGMFADSAGNAARAQGELVAMINKSLAGSGLLIADIESLSEVTALANAKMAEGTDTMFLQSLNREVTRAEIEAAKRARREFGDYVVEQQKAGNDVIEQITSEAGKAMMISFAGNVSAMERAESELKKAQDSVAMSMDRIKIAFKNLGATFIEDLGGTIKSVADSFMSFVERIQNMSPATRKLIVAVVGLMASIGPLVFIFGQVRLASGVMLETIMKLVPGLKSLSVATVATNPGLLKLKNGLIMTGSTIQNTNSRFATFIATLASGNGPIAKMADRFGVFTGMLEKTKTASLDVEEAIASINTTSAATLKTATAGMFDPKQLTGQSPLPTPGVVDDRAKITARILKSQGISPADLYANQVAGVKMDRLGNIRKAGGKFASQKQMDVLRAYLSAQAQADEDYRLRLVEFFKQSQEEAAQRLADLNAQKAKMPFYAKKKIDVTDTGDFMRKGKVISQASADRIAGGGIGSILERTKLSIKQLGELGKKPILKVKDMATAPINNFKKHVLFSKTAVDQLIARNIAFGKEAPGAFARARVSALAFGRSVLSASKMFQILKMTMLATGLGAIILGFAAAVIFLVKNFDKIRTQAAPGIEALKSAFEALKRIGEALIKPFLDFFATLGGGGGDKGKSTVNGIANAFNTVAKFIDKAASAVESFVNKYVVPLLYNALGGILNVIKGIGKFIQGISKLKSNWREALKMMLGGLLQVGRAILSFFVSTVVRGLAIAAFQVARLIVMAFTNVGKGVVNIFREMAKVNINIIFGLADAGVAVVQFIVDAFALLPRGIGNGIEAAANIFADFIDGVADAVRGTPLIGWLADKAGLVDAGRSAANVIRSVGATIGGVGRDIANEVSSLTDPLSGLVQSGRDAALGLVDGAADAINGFLDSIPDAIESAGDWVAGLLEDFGQGSDIGRGAGDALVDGTTEKVEEDLADELQDPFIDAGGEAGAAGGEAAGEEMMKKIAEIIQDLKQKFVDLVLDSVKGALDEATEQLADALEQQKEAALAVYDTQLKTLESLEKAEESLTREKEYQANRRRIIDERELQRANYQRNRALAIYEGRIDDARMLGLEDQKNQTEFQDNITKTDEERRRDLVKENLDYLKESIKNAQEETEKMLDQQIEAFQNAAKEITKFPPLTIEEYTSQLSQLNDAAKNIAGENGDILKEMMTKMKDNLKMPNANVGVFATGLDELIRVAQEKYGLTATTADNSIVGATIGMLAGIEGQIVGNRSDIVSAFNGIVTDVFNVASSFGNIADQVISPALDEMSRIFEEKNPMKVFEQAIKDANETILREMQRTVGHVASLVDGLANKIDEALIKLAIAQEKVSGGLGGGGGAGGGGGSTGGSTGGGGRDNQDSEQPPAGNLTSTIAKYFNIALQALNVGPQSMPPATAAQLKNDIAKYVADIKARKYTVADLRGFFPNTGAGRIIRYMFNDKDFLFYTQLSFGGGALMGTPSGGGGIATARYFGGRIPRFAKGGIVPGFASQGVPALLHGGEYIVNAKAVKNIGYAALEAMNGMRYASPGKVSAPSTTTINETQNVNIYVDTFIGEEQWFESMMKEYNVKVSPRNQKRAGLENRSISTYSGINRGA